MQCIKTQILGIPKLPKCLINPVFVKKNRYASGAVLGIASANCLDMVLQKPP